MFSAVCPTDPPTGWPWNTPEAMFPHTLREKSRFAWTSPWIGADSLTPVPWTSTITATASAPATRSNEKRRSSGSIGSQTPDGMLPVSATVATFWAPTKATTTEDDQGSKRGHRPEGGPAREQQVANDDSVKVSVGRWIRSG